MESYFGAGDGVHFLRPWNGAELSLMVCGCDSPGRRFTLTRSGFIPNDNAIEQPMWLALDISQFDIIDLLLSVWFDNPTGAGTVTAQILSGMQKQTPNGGNATADAGWYSVASFAAITSNTSNLAALHLDGTGSSGTKPLLRYIRWYIGGAARSASAVRFRIDGIGRSYNSR
jgi:hypothetical protein